MRVVLDTNVLIAAFVARGHCHELLEHVARAHETLTSTYILEELRRTLTEKLRVPGGAAEEAVALLASRLQLVEPQPLPRPVCRDPADDAVLGTAVAAGADCLVTGDGDLLALGTYEGIRIIRPASFWELEAGRPRGV